jgi:CRP/FNR family transcriptional regulator, cyclic AMP receptor protein
MSWVDIVGYAAALAVLCSFSMSAIVPLRILAIMSNVLFALYGVLADLYPVFFLALGMEMLNRCRSRSRLHLPRQTISST